MISEVIAKETANARDAVRTRSVGYISAGLGLVAGLAWNDAIRALIDYVFPSTSDSVAAKVMYAFVLTAAVAILLSWFERSTRKKETGN